jgi:hypothetical protein
MRAEEGRDHVDGALAAEPARSTELPGLGPGIEAIAGLDLDGGDALGEQRVEPGEALCDERVLARGARRLHGGDDPAAGTRDLRVGGAGKAQLEFVRAVAGVDEVRVAIDQAGRDPASLEPHALRRVPAGRQVAHGADERDPAVFRRDRAALDHAGARHGGEARVEPDGIEVHPLIPLCRGTPVFKDG